MIDDLNQKLLILFIFNFSMPQLHHSDTYSYTTVLVLRIHEFDRIRIFHHKPAENVSVFLFLSSWQCGAVDALELVEVEPLSRLLSKSSHR